MLGSPQRVAVRVALFAGLSVFLAFGALAIFTAMYPNVLPSTLDPAYSLTIANASSSEYTLGVMTFVTCMGLPVVFVYQAWTYWVFRKRLHVDTSPRHTTLPNWLNCRPSSM